MRFTYILKVLLLYFLSFCTSLCLADTLQESPLLHVIIKNIGSEEGNLRIILWDCPDTFLKEDRKPFLSLVVKPKEPVTTVTIKNLQRGKSYALFVHHDLKKRGKLRKNAFGKPIDPYAFGNNASTLGGPPDYKDALIKIKHGVNTHKVSLS